MLGQIFTSYVNKSSWLPQTQGQVYSLNPDLLCLTSLHLPLTFVLFVTQQNGAPCMPLTSKTYLLICYLITNGCVKDSHLKTSNVEEIFNSYDVNTRVEHLLGLERLLSYSLHTTIHREDICTWLLLIFFWGDYEHMCMIHLYTIFEMQFT